MLRNWRFYFPFQAVRLKVGQGCESSVKPLGVGHNKGMKVGLNYFLCRCALVVGLLCLLCLLDGGARAASSVAFKATHSLNAFEVSPLSFKSVAGRYAQGDPLVGSALTLTRSGRFKYSRHNCMGGSYNTGIYRLEVGYITLIPQLRSQSAPCKNRSHGQSKSEKKIKTNGFSVSPTSSRRWRFLPVHWGARLYLLEATEVLEFCNAINLGDEPFTPGTAANGSHFLMRVGDENKAVIGWPVLLEKGQSLFLPSPLYAQVLQVKKGNTITIDAGKKEGLFVGMVWTDNVFNFGNDYKVVAVSDDKAVLKSPHDQVDEKSEAKLKVAKATGKKYLPFFPSPAPTLSRFGECVTCCYVLLLTALYDDPFGLGKVNLLDIDRGGETHLIQMRLLIQLMQKPEEFISATRFLMSKNVMKRICIRLT